MPQRPLELLAPAKNLEQGIAAINCGADAVYIGAGAFGARASAGNSISDIESLANYAHKFNAKVYATVNTIFTDEQSADVRRTLIELYNAGADAYIIQDLGILKLDVPNLPIHASTQMDNYKPERIKFIESLGISRFVLARELSLEQIYNIRKEIKSELEFFVYGALCVSYSGRCYMSYAEKGRSANRGECAQLCRLKYDLRDSKGKYLFKDKYLLSLKDLDLSAQLVDLINAGVSSFKIEGRLKDINYVKNVTGYFRKRIDDILQDKHDYKKSSNGNIYLGFEPSLEKTFNRGKTTYFLNGRNKELVNFNTPKSLGEEIGVIKQVKKNSIVIQLKDQSAQINNGDGLCYLNKSSELEGFLVNSAKGFEIYPNKEIDIAVGTVLFRNQDHDFENVLKTAKTERKLSINLSVILTKNLLRISAEPSFDKEYKLDYAPAKNLATVINNIKNQFSKTGGSIFEIGKFEVDCKEEPSFIALSKLNEIRRDFFSKYEKSLLDNYKRELIQRPSNGKQYYQKAIDYQANVANSFAREVYTTAGVEQIEPAFEQQNSFAGKIVMTTKHCLKYSAGICPKYQKADKNISEPLYLEGAGHKYTLEFDCSACEMRVKRGS